MTPPSSFAAIPAHRRDDLALQLPPLVPVATDLWMWLRAAWPHLLSAE